MQKSTCMFSSYALDVTVKRSRHGHPEEGSMAPRLGFPVFDGDNHLYETRDALTKFLPPEYRAAIRYVEVDGRTKIATLGRSATTFPTPRSTWSPRPGAQEDYFDNGNPEGKTHREILGKPIRSTDAFREPAPRLALLDEQGVDKIDDVPDAGQPGRGTFPRTTPKRRTRSSTRSINGCTRRGPSTTRVASSPHRSSPCRSSRRRSRN